MSWFRRLIATITAWLFADPACSDCHGERVTRRVACGHLLCWMCEGGMFGRVRRTVCRRCEVRRLGR
jgi:hypothetical protein